MLSLPLLAEGLQLVHIFGMFADNEMESILEIQIIVGIMNGYNFHFLQHYSLFLLFFHIYDFCVFICIKN